MRIFQNASIRRKQTLIIMLISSVALLLACAAFIIYDTVTFRRELSERVTILADAIGNNCAAAIDFDDAKGAGETLAALRADNNIVSACIYFRDGRVLAVYQRDAAPAFVPPAMRSASQEFTRDELHLFRTVERRGEAAGMIFVASDLKDLTSRLMSYVVIVGMVFLTSLLAALLLSNRLQRLVSDPILQLAQMTRSVALEKNYSLRAEKQGDDEIGQLVDGFNEMLGQIQQRDVALQAARSDLARRVEERTRELAESQSLYHSLVDQMPAGVFRKDAAGHYVFVNSWYCRIKDMKAELILGKTPRELAAWESSIQNVNQPELARAAQLSTQGASHHELIMQTGTPIEVDEEYPSGDGKIRHLHVVKSPVFGPDGSIIGTQGMLFDVTGHKQAEAELSYERELLRSLLDYSPDPIYFKDAQSRFLRTSKNLAKFHGLKHAEDLVGKTDFDFFTEEHARPAFEDEQEILRTGRPIIGKVEKEVFKDGRESWALTSKMPLRDQDGRIIGTFGISKDITAIKEAEIKLDQVHKQLLETSRQAGMAEIASNVLHNVGNVLNSVNVSAGMVADSVKKSKVSQLAKVVALLREHEGDLGTFVANDSRGRHLPVYLAQLSDHLLADQETTVKELDSLRKNIEHIKEIVAMQQNFSNVSGVMVTVPVLTLVEDALNMNANSLNRHDIQVVREFADMPLVTVDAHKVVQILVNLMSNAKHACDDSGRADKKMTVRVANGDGRIRISVMDNGVGIPPENLTLIFNHGFTTRKDGHGFGLHSGALAAKDLGGSLTVHSDGPGRGATFILELPCQTKENPHE